MENKAVAEGIGVAIVNPDGDARESVVGKVVLTGAALRPVRTVAGRADEEAAIARCPVALRCPGCLRARRML